MIVYFYMIIKNTTVFNLNKATLEIKKKYIEPRLNYVIYKFDLTIWLLPPAKKIKISRFDWNNCCICQEGGSLICPANNPVSSKANVAYSSFAKSIYNFIKLNALPPYVNLQEIDQGSGIEDTFLKRKAKWHKKCYVQFNADKLQRIENKGAKKSDIDQTSCFLCLESETEVIFLHSVVNIEVDGKCWKLFIL